MPASKVKVGDKYNRWTVLERRGIKNRQSNWLCRCECGNEKEVRGPQLTSGKSKSCGCYNSEQKSKMASGYKGKNNGMYRHGDFGTRLYGIWAAMKRRCNNPNTYWYKEYGGRGIKVCDEWYDYINFKQWAMDSGYEDGLTIDRIDNDGDYKPDNCRWVNWDVQENNRRDNVYVEHKGVVYTPKEIAKITGLSERTIYARIKKGWSSDKVMDKRRYNGHGEPIE